MKKDFEILNIGNCDKNVIKELSTIGKIKYNILNPGGNTTALISEEEKYSNSQKKLINKIIMDKYPQVEQVGFLGNKQRCLEMAGGEFCINATRCAIYEYSKENGEKIELSVSGTNKRIIGRVINDNIVEIQLEIEKNLTQIIERKSDFYCIKLEGILIAILDGDKSKKYIKELRENEEITKSELKQIMINKLNSKEKAIGIMLLEKILGKIKINPIVWVKDIDTVFYETACGSGNLGAAIYNYINKKESKIEIIQPSGYNLNIELCIDNQYIKKAIITGIVKMKNKN